MCLAPTSSSAGGEAQTIGAMVYGVSAKHGRDNNEGGECCGSGAIPPRPEVPPCNPIFGPGNRWVTDAKLIVSVADSTADPTVVASDLIAQPKHDVIACAILVGDDPALRS